MRRENIIMHTYIIRNSLYAFITLYAFNVAVYLACKFWRFLSRRSHSQLLLFFRFSQNNNHKPGNRMNLARSMHKHFHVYKNKITHSNLWKEQRHSSIIHLLLNVPLPAFWECEIKMRSIKWTSLENKLADDFLSTQIQVPRNGFPNGRCNFKML